MSRTVNVVASASKENIYAGQKTVSSHGTAEALASSQVLLKGVRIKALPGNAGYVYVGTSDVDSTHGFVLDAGEEVFIDAANLATVYVDSDQDGDGVSYVGS